MTKKQDIHPEAARAQALRWLQLRLSDAEDLEEFWDNAQDRFEEPPELREILAACPQVLSALNTGQPLPMIHSEVRRALSHYLEEFDDTIAASELANADEEIRYAWTDAVLRAWVALRQSLSA